MLSRETFRKEEELGESSISAFSWVDRRTGFVFGMHSSVHAPALKAHMMQVGLELGLP
jgi:hypothetical protein